MEDGQTWEGICYPPLFGGGESCVHRGSIISSPMRECLGG